VVVGGEASENATGKSSIILFIKEGGGKGERGERVVGRKNPGEGGGAIEIWDPTS